MPGIIKPEQGSTVLKTKLEKIKPGQNWFKGPLNKRKLKLAYFLWKIYYFVISLYIEF